LANDLVIIGTHHLLTLRVPELHAERLLQRPELAEAERFEKTGTAFHSMGFSLSVNGFSELATNSSRK